MGGQRMGVSYGPHALNYESLGGLGRGGTLVDPGQRVAGLLGEPLKAGIQCLPRPSRDIPPLRPNDQGNPAAAK